MKPLKSKYQIIGAILLVAGVLGLISFSNRSSKEQTESSAAVISTMPAEPNSPKMAMEEETANPSPTTSEPSTVEAVTPMEQSESSGSAAAAPSDQALEDKVSGDKNTTAEAAAEDASSTLSAAAALQDSSNESSAVTAGSESSAAPAVPASSDTLSNKADGEDALMQPASHGKSKQEAHKKKHTLKALSAKKSEPMGWVIQIGSFSDKKNAVNLAKYLQKKGYSAYARSAAHFNKKKPIYRVLVGPLPKQSAAEQLRKTLKKQFHLKGTTIKLFEPLKD